MGVSEHVVVDVDAHYTDSVEDIVSYLDDDDPWKRRMQSDETDIRDPFPKILDVDPNFDRVRTDIDTREGVLEVMDELAIDSIIMISNQALLFPRMKADDERQMKFTEAYIDYMLDRIVDPERDIYMAVPIPHQNPARAAEIIESVADEPGIVTACFSSGMPEPPLGHRMYDPIYEAAEAADMPLIFHGVGGALDHFPVRGFSSPMEGRMLGFLWANIGQLTSLIVQGVPEKYPDLQFVFQECGIFYIPGVMYRLDAEYLKAPWNAPLLEKRPSKYLQENFWYGTQPLDDPPNERYFEYVIEMIGGADRLMYASDYPHHDFDAPSSVTDLSFLSSEEEAKILGGNAREVFGI